MIEEIVREHAEGAAFAWDRAHRAWWHPAYDAVDCRELTVLCDEHLDGLRIAGADAIPVVTQLLTNLPGAGEVYVATLFAVEHQSDAVITAVAATVASNPRCVPGAAAALIDSQCKEISVLAGAWQQSQTPGLRRAALTADVARRGVAATAHIQFATRDTSSLVRARAWRACGELRIVVDGGAAMSVEDDTERVALQLMHGWRGKCPSIVDDPAQLLLASPRDRLRLLLLLGALLPASHAHTLSLAMLTTRDLAWYAPLLLAVNGSASHIETLMQWLSDDRLNPVAGYAISHLTGVDPIDAALLVPHDEAGDEPTLGDEDDFGPFDELPRWIQSVAEAWWSKHRGTMQRGERIVHGLPWGGAAFTELLKRGSQLQRHQSAYALALAERRGLASLRTPL
jgi:uncharacterized protein (TIGR02270 family)